MSETEKTKRTYTRRTTRDKVVDLLEEAIRLVKARCVEPTSAVATSKAARDLLAESKKEFAEAVEMKRQANAALQTATAVAAPVEAAAPTKKTKVATSVSVPETKPTTNATLKVKKTPSCPGGPKAFNEFLKSKRAEVEAELGADAPYTQVRARIAQMWKETCSSTGTSKRTTRKLKTPATPGRVNAPVSLAVPEILSAVPEAEVESETGLTTLPEVGLSPLPETGLTTLPEVGLSPLPEVESETGLSTLPEAESGLSPVPEASESKEADQANLLTPVQSYEDLGMDDMFGMRKVRVDGRDLYMTDANKGLFNRKDEDDDPLGDFVGYLRNGQIVEQNAPNS